MLGSLPEARAGKLLVMVGAAPEQFQTWLPLLQALGEAPLRVGAVGTASALKLSLNQLIASLTTAFALSLSFVQQQGVPVETLMQIFAAERPLRTHLRQKAGANARPKLRQPQLPD